MKNHTLFALWGGLFALCAALGFIPNPDGALRIVLTLLSVVFFVPGGLLLCRAAQNGDRVTAQLVRNLSFASLVLTVILIVANFFTIGAGAALGRMLHSILVIVASPMVCSGYWALSLFLWACLLIGAIHILKAKKNP